MESNEGARASTEARARDAGSRTGRRVALGRRFAAVTLGLVLAPVALELGLRVAAFFVTGQRRVESSAHVVCQGDSNTYGLHLPGEQAYPAQLEALLRGANGATQPIVANLGVPGKTSWVVAEELREDLERYAPMAVVVLAGVNDYSDRRPAGRGGFLDRMRTVKMVRRLLAQWNATREPQPVPTDPSDGAGDGINIRQMRGPQEGHVESHASGTREMHLLDRTGRARPFEKFYDAPDPERTTLALRAELIGIVELVRAHGALPILLSYPLDSGRMAFPRIALREAAAATGALLVDPLPAFEEAQRLVEVEQLFYSDKHATELGYSIFARLVANALGEAGLIELAAPFDPLEEVRRFQPPELELEAWLEDGALVGLRARYAPGHRLQFVLGGTRGTTPFQWRGAIWPLQEAAPEAKLLPLELDKLARVSLARPARYIVPTDAEGRAEVRLDETLLGFAAEPEQLWAIAVVVAPGQELRMISEALRLR